MTTFAAAASTSHAASHPALASRVVIAAAGFFRAWKNRRAFYRLGELSDAQLADIGLARCDLNVAIKLGADPTTHLGAVAQARINEGRAKLSL